MDVSVFENLSNELFMEIFEYFDGYNLYHAFINLNMRINRILQNSQIRVNFMGIDKKHIFDYYCTTVLPFFETIMSLKLQSMHMKIFTRLFDFERLTLLQSLTLDTIELNEMKKHVLPKLPTLSNIRFLKIFDFTNEFEELEDNIHQVVFKLPNLLHCHLPYCRFLSSSFATNIKHLKIHFHSFNDLIKLFNYIPSIEYLNVCLHRDVLNNDVDSFMPQFQSKLKYLKISVVNIKFDLIEILLSNLLHLQHLSFSAFNLEYVDGRRWVYLLSNYLTDLKRFQFDVKYCCLPKSFLGNISRIILTFQTEYWLEHQWYFVFNYCPLHEDFHFYSYPCKEKLYVTEMNIFQSKVPQMSDIYDYVDELYVTLSDMENDFEGLKNTIGSGYWTSNGSAFQNAHTLVLSNPEIYEPNNFSPSIKLLKDLNQLIIWPKLKHLSYFYRFEYLEVVLQHASNIVSLDLHEKEYFLKITKCYPKIEKFRFEEGFLTYEDIEQVCRVFPNIKHFTLCIESLERVYAILPALFEKCRSLNYICIFSDLKEFDSASFVEYASKIMKNFVFGNNRFRLWIWCEQ
ncbi:unnamed protein product [Didymodactylos carnosus]|uniref:F-box domain-containing protein n=1 Tax=Didymodactylos carnosus TaxID=1234261 RepID=A0A814PZX8_9BILA|nr:unnamed protein product [Didymodactylos carnosus]CAF1112787.1 unnamed protein product [Didymodactylos carnosus]CAF3691358.1 unnamed protein product [Didymodactylos carnosus]CAF3876984.1 unnamed protein product [Didymodactylos carnosus]